MGRISIQSEGLTAERGARVGFGFILFGFLVYAGAFIFRTSFVIGGERYFSLFDDAMVSMRYARHFAAGLGLVWNPGERVEGYTNPLWVFFMAGAHLLPLPLSKISLVVQVSAALLLALNLAIVRRIALMVSDGSEATGLGAVVLTGWYLPLNNWSLQGMEVSALVVVVSAAVLLCLRCFEGDDVGALYVLLGASTWIRPDMVVPLAGIGCFMALVDTPRRKMHALWAGGALALGVASQTAFRLWYFGAPFPNTYYLKMTGYPPVLRIARGMYVLLQFVWKANPFLFALVLLRLHGRDRRYWLLAFVAALQMAYSVYVGGDAWEYWGGANRYIAIAMPAFFILLSDALLWITRRQTLAFACLVGVCALSINSISGPGALAELLLIKAPLHSGPGDENARDVAQALALQHVTAANASIGVTRAGTLPYFSDRVGVDFLGKADTRIAHEPSRVPGGARRFMDFRPGHSKWDDAYSIGELRPDVITQIWGDRQAASQYMSGYGRFRFGTDCAYARIDSPRIDVARLTPCAPAQ